MIKSRLVIFVGLFIWVLTAGSAFAKELALDEATKVQIKALAELKDRKKIQIKFCDHFVLNRKHVGKGQLEPFLKEMNYRLRELNKKPIGCNKNLRNLPEAKGKDRFLETEEVSYRSGEGFSREQLENLKTIKTIHVKAGTVISGPSIGGGVSSAVGGVASGGFFSSTFGYFTLGVAGLGLSKVIYDEMSKDDTPISGGNSSL